jgi:hypothetical protein
MSKITKLPPGEAVGARDLQRWSKRRLAGISGVEKAGESWQLRAKELLKSKFLRGRERKFLVEMLKSKFRPSSAQAKWMNDILQRSKARNKKAAR